MTVLGTKKIEIIPKESYQFTKHAWTRANGGNHSNSYIIV